ncbi:MAG: sigma-70 family RNA polymerase sigma factor [Planctomycetota bacterium]
MVSDKREELSKLAVLHHGPIFGYCRRRLGTDTDADDALQETFTRAFKYFASFDPTRDARKWLFGIAHNVCVEIARSRKRHTTVAEFPDIEAGDNVTTAALAKLAHEENMQRVRAELELMPDRARRVLELRFFGQMSAKEVAELEGMKETAVRVTVHRALEILRGKLARKESV